jgi:hypothetical protein
LLPKQATKEVLRAVTFDFDLITTTMAASSASAPTLSGHAKKSAMLSPAKLAEQYNQHSHRSSYPVLEAKGYDVHETIGVGGYSKVKLAIHRKTGVKVRGE